MNSLKMGQTRIPTAGNHFGAHLWSSSKLKECSKGSIIVTDTTRRIYYTLLSSASHFVPPLIPQFKHDTSMTTIKWVTKLVNKLNVCMLHEWNWWLDHELFGSGEEVPSLKFLTTVGY